MARGAPFRWRAGGRGGDVAGVHCGPLRLSRADRQRPVSYTHLTHQYKLGVLSGEYHLAKAGVVESLFFKRSKIFKHGSGFLFRGFVNHAFSRLGRRHNDGICEDRRCPLGGLVGRRVVGGLSLIHI